MPFAAAKPDTPAFSFVIGYLTSRPDATFAETKEAGAQEGHTITPLTWGRARNALTPLVELAPQPSVRSPRKPRTPKQRDPEPRAEHTYPQYQNDSAPAQPLDAPAPEAAPKPRRSSSSSSAPISVPLDLHSPEEIEQWQAVVQRIATGARFVLEFADQEWTLRERR